jgi:hypothetical protein
MVWHVDLKGVYIVLRVSTALSHRTTELFLHAAFEIDVLDSKTSIYGVKVLKNSRDDSLIPLDKSWTKQ